MTKTDAELDAIIDVALSDCYGDKLSASAEAEHRAIARAAYEAGRAEAIAECAKVCENLTYGVDINQWANMTKKGHAAHACRECAAAIRALGAE